MVKYITAKEFDTRPGEYANRAAYAKDRFVVRKRGKPWVVILSVDEYEEFERLEKLTAVEALKETFAKVQSDFKKSGVEPSIVEEALKAARSGR